MEAMHSSDRRPADAASILVVDDDILTRNYLSMLLKRSGYDVVSVPDLPSARSVLKESVFSLSLVDLTFPDDDTSGFDLVDTIRAQQPSCAVMIITSDQTAETAVEAIRLRVDDYFLKPIKSKELLSAIQQYTDAADDDSCPDDYVLHPPLTLREISVLQMFQQGYSYKKTANILGCSVGTVQTHAKHIYRKMGVHSRAEAAHEGLRLHLINP
jgi:DNA-binding NarL/FixJ family response regulator